MGVARVLGRELTAPCDVQRGGGVVTSVRVLIVDANVECTNVTVLWWRGGRDHGIANRLVVALTGNHQ